MPNKILYRIGGISAFLLVIFDFIDIFITKDVDGMGTKFDYYSYLFSNFLLALVIWALFLLFTTKGKWLGGAALVLSIFGVIMPLIDIPSGFYIYAYSLSHIIPVLVFGVLAFVYPHQGIPKVLGVIGILYAVLQILIYIVYRVSSDTFSFGFFDNVPMMLSWIWLAWTGFILLFRIPGNTIQN